MPRLGHRRIWLAALVLGATPTASQLGRAQSPFDAPQRTELARDAVDVPLTRVDGFYYVDVRLNGRPFRFTVETGAGFFAISDRAARAAGLRVDTAEVVPGSRAPVARVDSLVVGGATFRGLTARVVPAFGGGGGTEFDGLISIPLLRDVLATLDLGGASLHLARGALPAPNGRDVLPFAGQDRGGRVDVQVDVGDVTVPAVLDTRSSFWMIAPDSLAPRLALAAAPRFVTQAAGPSMGSFELRGARTTSDLRVGPVTVERPALLLRNRPGVLLGVPLLEQLVVTIDGRNQRVRVAPRGPARDGMPPQFWETAPQTAQGAQNAPGAGTGPTGGPVPAPGSAPASGQVTMGFGLAPRQGELRVAVVFAGSTAEQAGIKVGDQLVEFDGTPAAEMNPTVMRAAAARGQPVKLVLLRDGQRVEATVSPYRMP